MKVSKQVMIPALADKLKPLLKKPVWADVVKTGAHKEKPPVDPDWWFMRAASVMLKVEDLGPVGVSKLRTKYGGRKNRGVAPETFVRGSGNILRKVLQQLESNGLVVQSKTTHKGRTLTPKGKSMLARLRKELEGVSDGKVQAKG